MIDIPQLNQELVEDVYQKVSEDDITLEEYEERLDYYITDECPPKRIHYREMVKRAETFAMGEDKFALFGVKFERIDGTQWFERVDRGEDDD